MALIAGSIFKWVSTINRHLFSDNFHLTIHTCRLSLPAPAVLLSGLGINNRQPSGRKCKVNIAPPRWDHYTHHRA